MHIFHKLKFIFFFPFWYAGLLAYAFPYAIPLFLLIFGYIFILSLRWLNRAKTYRAKVLALLLCLISVGIAAGQMVMPFVLHAEQGWNQWFISGCGIKQGMTNQEVLAALKTRSTIKFGVPTQYIIAPRGLTSLKPLDMNLYGVSISTNTAGKVVSIQTWRD